MEMSSSVRVMPRWLKWLIDVSPSARALGDAHAAVQGHQDAIGAAGRVGVHRQGHARVARWKVPDDTEAVEDDRKIGRADDGEPVPDVPQVLHYRTRASRVVDGRQDPEARVRRS